jgi:hypothetical protein
VALGATGAWSANNSARSRTSRGSSRRVVVLMHMAPLLLFVEGIFSCLIFGLWGTKLQGLCQNSRILF